MDENTKNPYLPAPEQLAPLIPDEAARQQLFTLLATALQEQQQALRSEMAAEKERFTLQAKRTALLYALEKEGVQGRETAGLIADKGDLEKLIPEADGWNAQAAAQELRLRYPVCFQSRALQGINPPVTPAITPDPESMSDEAYYTMILKEGRM